MLKHDLGMAKLFNQSMSALNTRESESANFIRIESCPAATTNALGKCHNVQRIGKINECVADVAAISKVHSQVKEIKASSVRFVNQIQNHLLKQYFKKEAAT